MFYVDELKKKSFNYDATVCFERKLTSASGPLTLLYKIQYKFLL